MLNSWLAVFRIALRTFEVVQDYILLQIIVLLLNYFCSRVELEVAADWTTVFDNLLCKFLHISAI